MSDVGRPGEMPLQSDQRSGAPENRGENLTRFTLEQDIGHRAGDSAASSDNWRGIQLTGKEPSYLRSVLEFVRDNVRNEKALKPESLLPGFSVPINVFQSENGVVVDEVWKGVDGRTGYSRVEYGPDGSVRNLPHPSESR